MKQIFNLLLLSGILFACAQPVKKDLGIQLWSVREDMKADPAGTIEKIGSIGYTFIEAAGYQGGAFYGYSPEDFKALVEKAGMEFRGSHTGSNVPDSSNWESTMAWWDTCIDAHARAGVKYIVQPWMNNVGYESLSGLRRYCDYFNAVGEKCNAKGIRFGYHNHDGEFKSINDTVIYDFMLQNTDPDKVMFQLDLYWINKGGKVAADYFKAYPGRFESWHLKDEKELGESGKMDFATFFVHEKQSGVKNRVVEVEAYNFTPLESIAKSYEFLKNAEYVK